MLHTCTRDNIVCCRKAGGIENTIIQVMRIDATQYNLLFSAYTWLNIILCLIGGIVIDRFLGESYIPYLIGILYSVSYSFFGIAVYPVPALIVQEHQLVTAYGLAKSSSISGYTVISIIAGVIIDYAGYFFMSIYYLLLLYIVFIILIILWVMEVMSKESKINISGWKRRDRLKKEAKRKFVKDNSNEKQTNDLYSYDSQ